MKTKSIARPGTALDRAALALGEADSIKLTGVPTGYEGPVLARLLAERGEGGQLLFVAQDYQRAIDVEQSFAFFAPWAEVASFPAWDCLPYDRVSPSADVEARRLSTLTDLATGGPTRPTLIVTTANAIVQRLPDAAAGARTLTFRQAGAAHRHGCPRPLAAGQRPSIERRQYGSRASSR